MKSRAISLGVSVLNIFVLLLNCYGFFRQITYSRAEVIIYIVFTVIALVTSFAIGIFDYLEEKKGSGADESVLQRIVSIQNTLDGVRDEVLQANQIINGNTHKIVHNTEDDVYRYLYNWIQRGGKTVIVTRYLSWGNSTKQMSNMLKKKAKEKNLIICIYEAKNPEFLRELGNLGAEVYIHEFSHLNARFTMNYYEPMRKCTRVTIGTPNDNIKGGYINEPYDYESSPRICDLCWELFELIKISAKKFK